MVDAPRLNGLLAYAQTQPGGSAAITALLNHSTTVVMTGTTANPIPGDNSIPPGWNVTHAVITPDLAGVRECAAQSVPCVFDLELPVRPGQNPAEQSDPQATFAQARAIVGNGTLIAMPGENLSHAMAPDDYSLNADRFQGMIDLNVAGLIAPSVDYYGVQAQQLAHAPAAGFTYPSFVQAVTQQATTANPKVHMVSVLRSVASTGLYATPQEMLTAEQSVKGLVDGFWVGIAILPYPWTGPSRPGPDYSISYAFFRAQ